MASKPLYKEQTSQEVAIRVQDARIVEKHKRTQVEIVDHLVSMIEHDIRIALYTAGLLDGCDEEKPTAIWIARKLANKLWPEREDYPEVADALWRVWHLLTSRQLVVVAQLAYHTSHGILSQIL